MIFIYLFLNWSSWFLSHDIYSILYDIYFLVIKNRKNKKEESQVYIYLFKNIVI